ncbi:ABC transporter permease [Paenibacillus sacheonensis]|uniref:ABC transporter permease subunit n=1 Tax=Paenibacillus sacheonensis TaxID=742054 RepID=A0A7X4YQX1_9BACL|nr:ABC transporter permease subunit [Paenibacillus sacheonensis]MBM7567174.1 putative aldouronate transport system permease protein [Paenibacillus sacheonensis]NBC70901.1 ABC transporter permease subunit [Paenibacillus sacheonensis]
MLRKWSEQLHFNLMLLPGMLLVLVFSVWPMGGIILAFKHFIPTKGIWGSGWVGWDNYALLFETPVAKQVFTNTVVIALMKMAFGFFIPIAFALMLNELRVRWFKRTVQTVVYLPHFLSWVLIAGILRDLFAVDGIFNQLLSKYFGVEPIMFLGEHFWFRTIIVSSDIWKEFGFGTIIYLAALTAINPALYEAAEMDGASRMEKLRYITLPGIAATIVLVGTLSLQNVLNAGFDQIFNLYNALVYDSSDIIDTYVYRAGLEEGHFEIATAIGLMKSAISFVLIVISYFLASRFANYRIF